MSTWTVDWTLDGYVEVDAESRDEALAKFAEMSTTEIFDLGDHERPQAYHAEASADEGEQAVVTRTERVVHLPESPAVHT